MIQPNEQSPRDQFRSDSPNVQHFRVPYSPESVTGLELLPVPFARSCVIRLHCKTPKNGAAMFDWQRYDDDIDLTPLRFHAQRNVVEPASSSKPFPIVETQGVGFLAGYFMGYRQKEHGDMVFHNSGTRMHFRTHVKAENRHKGNDEYTDGMIEHDLHVGELLKLLDDLGIADSTIVQCSTDKSGVSLSSNFAYRCFSICARPVRESPAQLEHLQRLVP